MRNCDYYRTSIELKQAWDRECDKYEKCTDCKYHSSSLNDSCWAIFAMSQHIGALTLPCFERWLMDDRDETTTSLPASAGGRTDPQSARARPPAKADTPAPREKTNKVLTKKKTRGTGF